LKTTILILILLFPVFAFAQVDNRVAVAGKIVSEGNDVEGIAIYNTISNKGAISDSGGNFNIDVALQDKLIISALQFKEVSVVVNEEMITNKMFTILLIEKVNALDEVVILSHNLTGVLTTDVANVKPLNLIRFEGIDISMIGPDDIRMTKLDNVIMKKGVFYNGVDFAKILGLNKLLNNLLTKKKSLPVWPEKQAFNILDFYSSDQIMKYFDVPKAKVEAFVTHINTKSIDNKLLKKEKEIELLEYLLNQSKQFLKDFNGQN